MKAPMIRIWAWSLAVGLAVCLNLWKAAAGQMGTLPTGQRYLQNEIHFLLTGDIAAQLSPVNDHRRAVDRSKLQSLHPTIAQVRGGHTCARNWLEGKPLPAHIKRKGNEVPRIARSLKAILKPGIDAASVIAAFRRLPELEWADLSFVSTLSEVPNDTWFPLQWAPPKINATNAWDVTPATTDLDIAIVDSGVDLDHQDLAARISFDAGYGDFNTGNAPHDGRNGADHGTHVAGIAAAIRNNSVGIAGIAHVRIMALNCASWDAVDGIYKIANGADAINDAIANGAEVINCSWGSLDMDLPPSLKSALDSADDENVIVVVSAGNDSADVTDDFWDQHDWPIIVSATRSDDTLWTDSNVGPIDFSAPGFSIYSTVIGVYDYMNGTSMAAPHVSAALAMVLSMNPSLISPAAAKDILIRMAVPLSPARSFGRYGRVNLSKGFLEAVKAADAFVCPNSMMSGFGGYYDPYESLEEALLWSRPGDTLVLNGHYGDIGPPSYSYPPITIDQPVTLTALPDIPVVIGQ